LCAIATTLLQSTSLGGAWQMALDGALLDQRRPCLRFYRWSRPTLSLGFHQRQLQPAWLQAQERGQLDLVRRPSGGGAVLHGNDLCYALVWPDPDCTRLVAYQRICRWLQRALAQMGHPLEFGQEPAAPASPDCFARSTAADLVHRGGAKRIGSAQRWLRGCLLQHGSIQCDPQPATWRALLGAAAQAPPPLGIEAAALEAALVQTAQGWLELTPPQPLSADLLATAARRLERYRVGGASRDTSPVASMEVTTWGSARPSG
jgi:lipoate---protein ligase